MIRPTTHEVERADVVLAALRPEVDPSLPDWADATLTRILAEAPQTAARSRRRKLGLVAGGVVTIVVAGGAAYSSGLVPQSVLDRFGDSGDDFGHIDKPYALVDLTLSNGTPFTVWRAPNGVKGYCEVTDTTGEAVAPEDMSLMCRQGWPVSEDGRPINVQWVYADDVTSPLVLYGEVPDPAMRTVTVTGGGWRLSLPVDAETHGFASELPPQDGRVRLTIRYLDASGNELRIEHLWVG